MGGLASSTHKHNQSKLVDNTFANKNNQTKSSGHTKQTSSSSSKYQSTVYRIPTCKYHERCPSIKSIRNKHYTIYDLNHLTSLSHPRKHCQNGLKCKYFENVMKGSYSLPDLCHYSIYLHPISRFITSFPKNKKNDNDKDKKNKNKQNNDISSMYNSLQMPRSGKNGLMSYKKLGIMICDGGCGSSITRGLWKCWNFRDLIWNYKYRKYRKSKDPNYNQNQKRIPNSIVNGKKKNKKTDIEEDEERRNVNLALVTMIESVVALAGESFLIQMYDLMVKAEKYLNPDDNDNDNVLDDDNNISDDDDDKKDDIILPKTYKKRSFQKKRNSLIGQNKFIFEIQNLNLQNSIKDVNPIQTIITDEERNQLEFGELLLLFSDIVRNEFNLDDNEYPIIKKTKKWQCPMIYGVLLGMLNDRLKLDVQKWYKLIGDINYNKNTSKNTKIYTKTKKRRLKQQRKENIRKQIFIKGCKHSSRDLFKELQANNFTHVLSIPMIKNGANSNKRVDINQYNDLNSSSLISSSSSSSSDPNSSDYSSARSSDPNSFSHVSAIVAPNAPSSYRSSHSHYFQYKSLNYLNSDWTSLQEVCREKLQHPRHLEMGSCLEEEELLSILLLTGTFVGFDLIESHRKYRNYCKWRVLQNNLISSLLKLKKNDRTPNSNQYFHGLKKHLITNTNTLSKDNIYLFNTFVSTTLDFRLIESSFQNKKDGALLFLDRKEPVICADISWISKFPFEHEVLFAPCALTLPSPFSAKRKVNPVQNPKSPISPINPNHAISPKYQKHYYQSHNQSHQKHVQNTLKVNKKNYDIDRERVLSIEVLASSHNNNGKKDKKAKKAKKDKKKHKNQKKKDKKHKNNKKNDNIDNRDNRVDSLNSMGFSLVDGRLEALSFDGNNRNNTASTVYGNNPAMMNTMNQIKSVQSQSNNNNNNVLPSDHNKKPNSLQLKGNIVPTLVTNDKSSSNIDPNLIASFLYGKATPQSLFNKLVANYNVITIVDDKDNKDKDDTDDDEYIDLNILRQLFESLFLFAIQIEYATRNNGINPKYMKKYMANVYDVSSNYAMKYVENILNNNNNNSNNDNKLTKITKTEFINNAHLIHQLYEQFIENIIENEMNLNNQKWSKNNTNNNIVIKPQQINDNNDIKSSDSDIDTDDNDIDDDDIDDKDIHKLSQHNNVHPDYKEDKTIDIHSDDDDIDDNDDNDDSDDDDDDQNDDYYDDDDDDDDDDDGSYDDEDDDDDDDDDEVDDTIIENVEYIQQFCRGEITLLQLWIHFTDNNDNSDPLLILMNYISFDVLVYSALAYFVFERNPSSPLASRKSLNPLIDQLRLSLLAAYDPSNKGYVTYQAFKYFGDYLCGEYKKLRGSLAIANNDDNNVKHIYNKSNTLEFSQKSINSSVDVSNANNNDDTDDDDDDDDDDEIDEEDLIVLNLLDEMENNAQKIINNLELKMDIIENDDDDDDDDDIYEIIDNNIDKLLYLTKEMEIRCNTLKNYQLRYKKAKLINSIDSKREEIQINFNNFINIDDMD